MHATNTTNHNDSTHSSPLVQTQNPHRFIKYCGFTRLVDAIYATSLGVNALGFVFYEKSPRYISPQNAASIIKTIQHIKNINNINNINNIKNINSLYAPYLTGLFVNHSYQEVLQIATTTNIDLLQFHGDESADFCESIIAQLNKPYIKVISIGSEISAEDNFFDQSAHEKLKKQYPNAFAFLLDKKSASHGGSGQKFNWQNVDAKLFQQNLDLSNYSNDSNNSINQYANHPAGFLILAGGIFLEDMDELQRLNINSIDLSTGIEIEKASPNNANNINNNFNNNFNNIKGIKSARLMYEIAQNWQR